MVSIKRGQGKLSDQNEIEETQWKQSDKKDFLSLRDYTNLYNIFTNQEFSHARITDEYRQSYINNFELARKNRNMALGISTVGIYMSLGILVLGKKFSVKKGVLGMVGGTIFNNVLHLTLLEKMYNGDYIKEINKVTRENYDILEDPKYIDLIQPGLLSQSYQDIQQFSNSTKSIIENNPDKEMLQIKLQEYNQILQQGQLKNLQNQKDIEEFYKNQESKSQEQKQ